jgi:hypothetical protein
LLADVETVPPFHPNQGQYFVLNRHVIFFQPGG